MSYAKETIISAKGIEQQVREAESIIEVLYGQGYATRYDIENSSSYGRKNTRGKGKNSGTSNTKTAIREWRFDDEQITKTETQVYCCFPNQVWAETVTHEGYDLGCPKIYNV